MYEYISLYMEYYTKENHFVYIFVQFNPIRHRLFGVSAFVFVNLTLACSHCDVYTQKQPKIKVKEKVEGKNIYNTLYPTSIMSSDGL